MARIVALSLLLLCLVPNMARSQETAGAEAAVVDRSGAGLAGQALLALTGGSPIADVVLSGRVTRFAGSEVSTGRATLKSRITGESRLELDLPSGPRTAVHTRAGGTAQGMWVDGYGQTHEIAWHNSWTSDAWFFPAVALTAALTDQNVAIEYVGRETRDGSTVEHIRISRIASDHPEQIRELIQQLSSIDIYLDAASYLPLVAAYNGHPDNDMNADIPIELQFGDYRLSNGGKTPFRIQKFVNNGVVLDLAVETVSLNSDPPDDEFKVKGGQQ